MENKNKNLIFLCDINGTITSCYTKEETTAFHDTFHGTTEVRRKNLIKLAKDIAELKETENCDRAYFSFFSGEEKDVVIFRVNEVKEIFDEYGIEIVLCGCESIDFSGYIFFDGNTITYKEEKEKTNKMDLIRGIMDRMQKDDCIVYADDSLINRKILGHFFAVNGFTNFVTVDSDCVIDGQQKHGLRGLVGHLDELVETKKNKRKR